MNTKLLKRAIREATHLGVTSDWRTADAAIRRLVEMGEELGNLAEHAGQPRLGPEHAIIAHAVILIATQTNALHGPPPEGEREPVLVPAAGGVQ